MIHQVGSVWTLNYSLPWLWGFFESTITETDRLTKKVMTINNSKPHLSSLIYFGYLLHSSICTGTFGVYVVLVVWDCFGVSASYSQADNMPQSSTRNHEVSVWQRDEKDTRMEGRQPSMAKFWISQCVSTLVYKLTLPLSMEVVHPVFHVSVPRIANLTQSWNNTPIQWQWKSMARRSGRWGVYSTSNKDPPNPNTWSASKALDPSPMDGDHGQILVIVRN